MLCGVWCYIFVHDISLYLYIKGLSTMLAIIQIDGVPLPYSPRGVKSYPVGQSCTIGEGAFVLDDVVTEGEKAEGFWDFLVSQASSSVVEQGGDLFREKDNGGLAFSNNYLNWEDG